MTATDPGTGAAGGFHAAAATPMGYGSMRRKEDARFIRG
jgi:hypothetical protein